MSAYKFIVVKYMTTSSGVLLTYPGALMDKTYDPTRRECYIKAVANPGKTVFTAPYLDVGGACYIVTLSHTILEPKSVDSPLQSFLNHCLPLQTGSPSLDQ